MQMLSSRLGQEVWLEGPSRGRSSVLPTGKLQKAEWAYSEEKFEFILLSVRLCASF